MALEATRNASYTLVDLIDRILDKGLVINADIAVSLAGVELLGIKIRASLASIETAAKYGLEFPSGTDFQTAAWENAKIVKERCPQCDKMVPKKELMLKSCPWCGWTSAVSKVKTRGKMVKAEESQKNESDNLVSLRPER